MPIRVLAIDDEPLALQQLAAYISKVPFLQLCGQCLSAVEARELLERDTVDALFCDINMPDLNGMDFVRQLAAPPFVVFTTAYADYAVEGYRLNAVDYLLKPFGLQDFQRAALKLKRLCELRDGATLNPSPSTLRPSPSTLHPSPSTLHPSPSTPSDGDFFVKTDSRTVRVAVSDIRYVEAMSEYLKLHLDSQQRPLIAYLSMKRMEDFLPPADFMRIHRSYIVNLSKVCEVNKNRVVMGPDEYIPIGDNYREAFNDYLATRTLTR